MSRNFELDLDWVRTRKGSYIASHPDTGETVTVFRNRAGNWSGVWNDVFLSGHFESAQHACWQMERWLDGGDVPLWHPPQR